MDSAVPYVVANICALFLVGYVAASRKTTSRTAANASPTNESSSTAQKNETVQHNIKQVSPDLTGKSLDGKLVANNGNIRAVERIEPTMTSSTNSGEPAELVYVFSKGASSTVVNHARIFSSCVILNISFFAERLLFRYDRRAPVDLGLSNDLASTVSHWPLIIDQESMFDVSSIILLFYDRGFFESEFNDPINVGIINLISHVFQRRYNLQMDRFIASNLPHIHEVFQKWVGVYEYIDAYRKLKTATEQMDPQIPEAERNMSRVALQATTNKLRWLGFGSEWISPQGYWDRLLQDSDTVIFGDQVKYAIAAIVCDRPPALPPAMSPPPGSPAPPVVRRSAINGLILNNLVNMFKIHKKRLTIFLSTLVLDEFYLSPIMIPAGRDVPTILAKKFVFMKESDVLNNDKMYRLATKEKMQEWRTSHEKVLAMEIIISFLTRYIDSGDNVSANSLAVALSTAAQPIRVVVDSTLTDVILLKRRAQVCRCIVSQVMDHFSERFFVNWPPYH